MCPSGRTTRWNSVGMSDFRPAFDVIDVDGDGKISKDDLRTFYSGTNIASEEDIGSMIWMADSNKDGLVGFDEFEQVLSCQKYSPVNEAMKEVFKLMDKDGDGKIGFDDLKSYMNWAGLTASDEDIRAMIKLGGGDENDGGVCYEGLLKILAVDVAENN